MALIPFSGGDLRLGARLAALLFACLALGLNSRRINTGILLSLLLVCLFGLMLFQSRRFIEYFPPFVLVFAAFSWAPLLEGREDQNASPAGRWQAGLRDMLTRRGPALLLALAVFAGILYSLPRARLSLQDSRSHSLYAGASTWLEENTPAGSLVFQTDWDDFPRLFFYNTHNTYLVGLDPT